MAGYRAAESGIRTDFCCGEYVFGRRLTDNMICLAANSVLTDSSLIHGIRQIMKRLTRMHRDDIVRIGFSGTSAGVADVTDYSTWIAMMAAVFQRAFSAVHSRSYNTGIAVATVLSAELSSITPFLQHLHVGL